MDKIIFFFLGRLDKDKNAETLIRALPFTSPDVHMVITGNGKEKPFLHNLAATLEVEDKITWFPTVNQEQMLDLYHAADCFTLMSPYEIQSIVSLQALACGLPVILANAGALPELAQPGRNGFLVDTYDHQKLALVMNQIARDKNLRSIYGSQSRIISLEHHKPTVLAKLEQLYQSLI